MNALKREEKSCSLFIHFSEFQMERCNKDTAFFCLARSFAHSLGLLLFYSISMELLSADNGMRGQTESEKSKERKTNASTTTLFTCFPHANIIFDLCLFIPDDAVYIVIVVISGMSSSPLKCCQRSEKGTAKHTQKKQQRHIIRKKKPSSM